MTTLVDPRVYGATGNGVDDDAPAIKAAIADVIASGGGVVDLTALRAPKILSVLDLSDLKGRNLPLEIRGAGSGNTTGGGGSHGTTVIGNGTGGTAIKAVGSLATNAPIVGITLTDLMIQNLGNLGASPYTVDFDYCVASITLRDVFVDGGSHTGNGIAFRNMAKGQSAWENVTVRRLSSAGTGFRISAETTVDNAAINSGNSTFSACTAEDCSRGWVVTGPGNLLNGLTFLSCKAVNAADIAGSIGFYLLTNVHACTLVAPHSERFSTGYQLEAARHIKILSPLSSYPSPGTPDANSAGVRIKGTSFGNEVDLAQVRLHHYGVRFEDSARMNWASGADVSGQRVLTSFFSDTSADGSNATEYLDASPTGVRDLAGRAIRGGRSATGSRPGAASVGVGAQWFDTTLSKPIWSDGTQWVDATGAAV